MIGFHIRPGVDSLIEPGAVRDEPIPIGRSAVLCGADAGGFILDALDFVGVPRQRLCDVLDEGCRP
ncbi:hypothetical protein ACVKXF_002747 [Curtobacterium sp. PvP017]